MIKLETTFFLERIEDRVRFLGSLEGSDQFALLIIKGEVGEAADLIEGRQDEFLIPADQHVRVPGDVVVGVELFHLLERLIGGHDDLDIPEFAEIAENGFRLVFAMLAVGTEIHDDGAAVLFDVVLGQVGRAVQFEQMKGRDGGKPHKWRLGIGRIGGRLVGYRRLGGKEVAADEGQNGEKWFFHRAKLVD